ncbi:PREDICTED: zinc finger CCCH domain-containing protein 29 [Ipomoea nil]|uniref:zinc finger CCCH domain-containing protein 29 n=1 Tax=Ipomoea nil TaxID=35883 RepID=UPI00090181D5|nr:PREDICTED: zinc finger CCCH domain-containing protein 29 [Ipomoea nil]XP_019192218.1 PREDICTED: zinc finger CCCH domain-containing protein 29 [Ipomoea nil]XP_019192219.1 PREDICTED: zinc finger CCCH domain-containing protein 29 [Ipomoea nil]XP_019192220.1 PREDICTED: zinc finger CCCH domain-containing protein 29 [Ipomoea nil]
MKGEYCPLGSQMEKKDGFFCESCSKLLEFSAADDVGGFIGEVEGKGCDVNELSLWYGRRIGSRKMGLEERSPLMIASMYGSVEVLKYIVQTGKVDVNMACGSDGATALHCAVAGGSEAAAEVVKILVDASADVNCVDASGNKPYSLKSSGGLKRRTLELLKGKVGDDEEEKTEMVGRLVKEYPIDTSLPDINNGIYGSDEFRMYSFKIKPCSRAYSHDWTECPFVHPGENARRRDPRKYTYSCVPCPEFKKGSCGKGDACEFAHGIFESWLHPAQYRTRLCKDETGCSRKVCFFAHKPEELRPLYASTGSAIPSPKSVSVSSMDMATLSPLALGSSSLLLSTTSTPPMSPTVSCSSSPMWQNKMNFTPPTLQLPGSRLKTARNARDLELEMELLSLESIRSQQHRQQQLVDEMAGLSSPSHWNKDYNRLGDFKPTNLEDVLALASLDSPLASQLQCLSPKVQSPSSSQLQSPIRQNMNQLRASYPATLSSSPARKTSSYGYDSSAAVAAAVMNSRSAGFAKRSQSFIDRSGGATHHAANSRGLSDWSSPDGKLDWGFNGDDLNKLKRSSSFGIRGANASNRTPIIAPSQTHEPDVSWVHDPNPSWIDQMLYIEQEQMVA